MGNPGVADLIAWWTLNEESGTRADSHGSNTLADNNTVLYAAGKIGNAADFERSTSEYLSIADNAALSFADEDFTIGAWVKPESYNAQNAGIMGKYSIIGGDLEYELYYSAGAAKFKFIVSNDGTASAEAISTTGSVATGSWHFVVGWHDSVNNEIGIQVSGGTDFTTAHTTGVNDGALNFNIGQRAGGLNYWDGLVDEAFVYGRVLTSDERTWLYNSGSGRTYSDIISVAFMTTNAGYWGPL